MAQDSADQALPGARTALLLLLAINLFNYIDRQVLAAVEPKICAELFPTIDDSQAKFLSGLLASAFLVTYTFVSPIFGYLSDRKSRWFLIAIGVAIWSLASGASGLAPTFAVLLVTRCFVGFGEAAYGPAAPSIISDFYPVKNRGKVLAWFYMAIPVGSALGYTLGGQVSDVWGWRWAFYAVVPPGLLLAFLCLRMPEPPRGLIDAAKETKAPRAGLRDYRVLLRIRSYVYCTLGMTAMTFALGGIAWWIPAYLEEYRHYKTLDAFGGSLSTTTLFGAITALTGLIATLLGGYLGDLLRPRWSGSYFLVSGMAMLLAAPCIIWFVYSPFPFAWIPLSCAVFCLFFNTGPTNTILANVTHPSIRATAFALNIFIIHIFGDVISPPILGAIIGPDRYPLAFQVVAGVVFAGGIFWLMGSRYLERDTEQAPLRTPSDVNGAVQAN